MALLYLQIDVPHPKVIITDGEKALIGSIHRVFPRTDSLLCIWHINKYTTHKRSRHKAPPPAPSSRTLRDRTTRPDYAKLNDPGKHIKDPPSHHHMNRVLCTYKGM